MASSDFLAGIGGGTMIDGFGGTKGFWCVKDGLGGTGGDDSLEPAKDGEVEVVSVLILVKVAPGDLLIAISSS